MKAIAINTPKMKIAAIILAARDLASRAVPPTVSTLQLGFWGGLALGVGSLTLAVASESTWPQMSLFTEYLPNPVVEKLREADLDALRPIDAFDLLRKWQDELGQSATEDSPS